jgi:hypothetical protein
MMKRMMLTAALLLCVVTQAQAQSPLDRLRNRAKEDTERKSPDGRNAPDKSSTANEPVASAHTPTNASAQAGQDSKYPPGILYSSLLTGFILHPNGNMTMDKVSATFLLQPPPSTKTDRPYNPYDGGKLETVIKSTDGRVVETMKWFARPMNNPFWLLESHLPSPFVKMTPGTYVAEFMLEGKLFYRFPFSVVKESGGDDPFAAGASDKLVLKGAWEDFGYLHLPQANPSAPLQYKSWFRAPVKKGVDISVEIVRESDGKKVAESDPNTSERLATNWERLTFEMRKPGLGPAFTGLDLLGADGKYKLVVKIDGKPYGMYPFAVQGGKIQYHPRQRRGEADALTFIEGGNDAWFVEREK